MSTIGRKSYGCLVFMAMVAVYIASGIGYAQSSLPTGWASPTAAIENQNMSTAAPMTNVLTYENSTFGFKMNYPSDWIMHEAGPNNMNMVVGFLAPGEDMNTPMDYVIVQVESLPTHPAITVDQYAQAIIANLKKSYSDFNLLSEKDIEFSRSPGKELSYTMSSGQSDYHNVLAFTIKNNKAYTITLDSLYDKYTVFQSSAEEMINSFEFELPTSGIGGTIGAPLMSH